MLHGNLVMRQAGFLAVAAVLGLAACAGETPEQGNETEAATEMTEGQAPGGTENMGEAPHGRVSSVAYECADGGAFTLTVASGVAKAALRLTDGEIHQLDEVEVASGIEFSDGTFTFRGMGPEGSVEKDGEPFLTGCTASGHPQ